VHAAIKDNPKYAKPTNQARPLTINAIIETADSKLPIGYKRGSTTDQGDIRSLTGIGFMDILQKRGENLDSVGDTVEKYLEPIGDAVRRRVTAEWKNITPDMLTYENMKPLILVDNAVQNFDLAFGVYVKVPLSSNELVSNELHEKGKFKQVYFVDTAESSLYNEILDFARKPKTSSGHMIGDAVSLLAYKHGGSNKLEKYTDSIRKLVKDLAAS
jgi:hypothetical protein